MTDGPQDLVTELVAEGRLERIARDQSVVRRTLAQASMNLQGADRELQAGNAGGAYALLWDGLRAVDRRPHDVASLHLGKGGDVADGLRR